MRQTWIHFILCTSVVNMNTLLRDFQLIVRRGSASYTRGFANASKVTKPRSDLKSSYDVVIVGAGHNALVSAAYLQKAGRSVCVLEKRRVIGGAAVTEEIVPGFKFSRASYLLSLLRPYIISDLKLKEFGLKFYMREPYNSYTPIKESRWYEFKSKSLLLSSDPELSRKEIAKFSPNDAQIYETYEKKMGKFVDAITHLIDARPVNLSHGGSSFLSPRRLNEFKPLWKTVRTLGLENVGEFHELLTAPASKILNKWFESEPLKASLATDALIGTYSGPHTPGTGYVLLHHIMGGVDEKPGAWAYVEGGMGAVSEAIGQSAHQLGAHIFTDAEVSKIITSNDSSGMRSIGVVLSDGTEVHAKSAVLSGATPHVTFEKLLSMHSNKVIREHLGHEFVQAIQNIDYTSPVTKINVALDKIPNFAANPNSSPTAIHDWHKCTIHINCETMQDLQDSYESSKARSVPSTKPLIEMVIPSTLDPTLTTKTDAHVCLLFTQYTPHTPANGHWSDPTFKEKYAESVFNTIEEYAPGFKASVIGKEVLTPWDLEQTFGLTGGNIFHGSMSVDQLYWIRPIRTKRCWFPETPIKGLYLCGSGVHPGGGVMGVPGYLAAKAVLAS